MKGTGGDERGRGVGAVPGAATFRLNGRWRHFKGAVYVVTGIARNTETHAEMVVYHSEAKPDEVWVRPLWMWEEPVPGGSPRFVRLVPGPAGGDGGGRVG